MSTVAKIAFRYDGDPNTEEIVHDLNALDSRLKSNASIERDGRRWKIVEVEADRPLEELPLWRVAAEFPGVVVGLYPEA
jgi:hypothetical protein